MVINYNYATIKIYTAIQKACTRLKKIMYSTKMQSSFIKTRMI